MAYDFDGGHGFPIDYHVQFPRIFYFGGNHEIHHVCLSGFAFFGIME
jgi:hypothetical protein